MKAQHENLSITFVAKDLNTSLARLGIILHTNMHTGWFLSYTSKIHIFLVYSAVSFT